MFAALCSVCRRGAEFFAPDFAGALDLGGEARQILLDGGGARPATTGIPGSRRATATALSTAGSGGFKRVVIDAPMSGGPVRARDGQMSLMLSGSSQTLNQCTELLEAITPHRFVISETPGDAAKTKLANNLLAAINLAGVSEVLAMAQSWGLNPSTTLSVMQASSGQSWIGQDRMKRALENDFLPRAHTSLLAKDTRLALQACDALGVGQPSLGQLATEHFEKACAEGYKDMDDASLFLLAGGKPISQ